MKNSGRCHSAQIGPRIIDAASGLNRSCNRGSAKSRQPGSSASPVVTNWMSSSGTYMLSAMSDGAWISPPENTSPVSSIPPGTPSSATVYQRPGTRQRSSRPTQLRTPARPSVTAVTRKAEEIGPRYAPGRTPTIELSVTGRTPSAVSERT